MIHRVHFLPVRNIIRLGKSKGGTSMNTEKTGSFIRELRKEAGLTQQQLAEAIMVSDKAVSRWETGRGFPDIGNLEDLADALGVNTAEILKGERIPEGITKEDMMEVSDSSISLARSTVQKRKWQNLALGFLTGAIILLLIVAHLMSPVYITGDEASAEVTVLSDGRLILIMGEGITGYDIGSSTDPDTGENSVFVGCYYTLWDLIRGGKENIVAVLGEKNEIGYVYYYPSEESDLLIWHNEAAPEINGGAAVLPRLIYNYWILLGTAAGIILLIVCWIFRRKYYFTALFRVTMIPVSFTISTIAVLMGHFGEVYNASYYLSGIMLMAVMLYFLILLFYEARRERKRVANEK